MFSSSLFYSLLFLPFCFKRSLVSSLFSASFCLTHFLLFGSEGGLCLSSDRMPTSDFLTTCLISNDVFRSFLFEGVNFFKKLPYRSALMYGKCLLKIGIAAVLFRVTALGHTLHKRHLQRVVNLQVLWVSLSLFTETSGRLV